MTVPGEIPVMILENATLFPQTLLPLRIFELRYRRMLADVLASHRMFCVAMRKPGSKRESPSAVAGLGLIRAAVDHQDGTSHLILQGLTRVQLGAVVRYRPYRVQAMKPMPSLPCDTTAAGALVLQVRDLLTQRFKLDATVADASPVLSAKEILTHLDKLTDAEQVADLISCTILQEADERQAIMEASNVETRLQRLIRFLMADIQRLRQIKPSF